MKFTIKLFNETFPNDDVCLQFMFDKRFGDMIVCPKCAVVEPSYYRVRGRKCYECKDCGNQIHPLANSIFHKSETPLKSWFYAIYLFSASKNGVSAKELERHLGVTYKTAWRMCKLIRSLMAQDDNILGGDVEVDETYAPSRKHPRPLGHSKKQVIFGAVERNGRVNAQHIRSAGVRVIMPILTDSVSSDAHVFSDEALIYDTLEKRGYSHTTVNHSKLEYVRGTAHTNTIEGFWSQLKRSIDGTYHSVSPKYLQHYINEFAYRYNHRSEAGQPMFLNLLEAL